MRDSQRQSPQVPKDKQVVERLQRLALLKNRAVSADVLDAYTDVLLPYPLELIDAAILALAADGGEWFPPVGTIIAAMGDALRGMVGDTGRPLIAPLDEAWQIARRTISRYAKAVRPNPTCGNPAIDGAIRDIGGVAACQWADGVAEGIVRRQFAKAYEEQIRRPAVIAWALSPAAQAPPEIAGIEMPQYQITELVSDARDRGVAPPPLIAAAAAGDLPTAPIRKANPALALPASPGATLTPERRAEIRATVRESIGKMTARMKMPPGGASPADTDRARGDGATVVRWRDGETSVVAPGDQTPIGGGQ